MGGSKHGMDIEWFCGGQMRRSHNILSYGRNFPDRQEFLWFHT